MLFTRRFVILDIDTCETTTVKQMLAAKMRAATWLVAEGCPMMDGLCLLDHGLRLKHPYSALFGVEVSEYTPHFRHAAARFRAVPGSDWPSGWCVK